MSHLFSPFSFHAPRASLPLPNRIVMAPLTRMRAGSMDHVPTALQAMAASRRYDALVALGKRLRTQCGTGGTARDGVLELQGDHRERAVFYRRSDMARFD